MVGMGGASDRGPLPSDFLFVSTLDLSLSLCLSWQARERVMQSGDKYMSCEKSQNFCINSKVKTFTRV